MMAIAKKYKIVTVFLFVEVILFVSAPDISKRSWTNSIKFTIEEE